MGCEASEGKSGGCAVPQEKTRPRNCGFVSFHDRPAAEKCKVQPVRPFRSSSSQERALGRESLSWWHPSYGDAQWIR